jgi:IstB-like ATP binding protein
MRGSRSGLSSPRATKSGNVKAYRPSMLICLIYEILEERYGRRSTILTSQIPVDKWHAFIGDPTYADAILDRLVHNTSPNFGTNLLPAERPPARRHHFGTPGDIISESAGDFVGMIEGSVRSRAGHSRRSAAGARDCTEAWLNEAADRGSRPMGIEPCRWSARSGNTSPDQRSGEPRSEMLGAAMGGD